VSDAEDLDAEMPKLPILWQAISCPSSQSHHHTAPGCLLAGALI
jgi:hypothetical protein